MKTTSSMENGLVDRASEALKAVLGASSWVRLTELKCEPPSRGRAARILARIDVLGRIHTLVCEVKARENLEQLQAEVENLRVQDVCADAPDRQAQSTRVIIAPYLSPEAQALCKETNTCFVDLEGNARIALGEIFIGKRTMRPRVEDCLAIDPVIIQDAKVRAPAQRVYISSKTPGSPPRIRENVPRGIAVA